MSVIDLEVPSRGYKPFRYPWAHTYWKRQQQVHWMPEEVPMGEDVQDWNHRLTDEERHFLTQIFRFFVQSDIDVGENYMDTYSSHFKPFEVKMMLAAFSAMETIHVEAYALLIDTVGMPETDYAAFLDYDEMRAKHEAMQEAKLGVDSHLGRLLNMATFGAFTEGLALFASFAMLMNFPRFSKMKGMGQIVSWSIRDETLHCEGIVRLFREYRSQVNLTVEEDTQLEAAILEACVRTVSLEDAFVDRAFEMGGIRGVTAEDIKQYVRFVADIRMQQLGYAPIYGIHEHPLPWLPPLISGVEHANFFENRATEYSKGASEGDWGDAWDD
jgi:ribonucleoside-diphosphate reductase beta chain